MQAAIVASFAASALAAPLVARQSSNINDGVILNYALTLEHLEATFYREALAKYSAADFAAVGLGADFYSNLQEIASDEKTHVDFLTTALTAAGVTPVQECTYKFNYTSVQGFLATANLLEGVGVSAYLGAAQFIANKDYLTAAGAILTVEARHSSFIRDWQVPKPLSPFPAPFDIPQSFNNVFSLAAPLLESCPDGSAGTLGLPFTAYPSISVAATAAARAGDMLTFTVSKEVDAAAAWFITFPGGPIRANLATANQIDYQVTVPGQAQPGQAYVVFTSDDQAPTDDNTVAGPAVFEILDNAGEFQAANPDYDYFSGGDNGDCNATDPENQNPSNPPTYGSPTTSASEGNPTADPVNQNPPTYGSPTSSPDSQTTADPANQAPQGNGNGSGNGQSGADATPVADQPAVESPTCTAEAEASPEQASYSS